MKQTWLHIIYATPNKVNHALKRLLYFYNFINV